MRKLILLALLVLVVIPNALALFPSRPEVVTYYAFEDGTSNRIQDIALNAHNLSAATGQSGTLFNGKVSRSLKFDGINDYYNSSNINGLNMTTNFSIQSWVYWNGSATNTGVVLGKSNANQINYRLEIATDNRVQLRWFNDSFQVLTSTPIPLNTWTHVVTTWNGSLAVMYINGAVNNSTSFSLTPFGNTGNLTLGRDDNAPTATYFNGSVDEVSLWNKTLTSTDVSSLYNSGNGISLLTLGLGVILNSPTNNGFSSSNPATFNVTLLPSPGGNLTNATLYLYNNSGLVGTTTSTVIGLGKNSTLISRTLALGNYSYNVLGCLKNATATACEYAPSNLSFMYGYSINSETWTNVTAELASQEFKLNVSVISDLSSVQGTLVYNNTRFLGSMVTEGNNRVFTKSVNAPDVASEQNVSFYWEINLNDGTTNTFFNQTTHNQTVRPITLDNCTTNTLLIYNYTIKDETNREQLASNQNTSVQLSLVLSAIGNASSNVTFSQTYNATNPSRVCITSEILNTTTFRVDSVAQYSSSSRVQEYYNIQNETLNNNTIPRQIDLYDLAITSSQEFAIKFLDNNFLPVGDALIDIQRKYVGLGQALTVEIPKTDSAGTTIAHLVVSDAIYDIYVRKEGRLLATYTNQRVYCQDQSIGRCDLNLNQGSSTAGIVSFRTYGNMSYYTIYNQTTRQFSFVYFTTDGTTKNVIMNMSALNGVNLNESACYQTLSSSSGTLSCTPGTSLANKTLYVIVRADNLLIVTQQIKPLNLDFNAIGTGRFLLAAFIIVAFILLGIASPGISMLFFALSLIVVGLLNLLDFGEFYGAVSAFVLVIIAGGIIFFNHQVRERNSRHI